MRSVYGSVLKSAGVVRGIVATSPSASPSMSITLVIPALEARSITQCRGPFMRTAKAPRPEATWFGSSESHHSAGHSLKPIVL